MSVTKIIWRKEQRGEKGLSAQEYEQYILNKSACLSYEGMSPGIAAETIIHSSAYRTGRSNNVFVDIPQSFSPYESESLTPDKVNRLGVELATRSFPHHDYMVVTHVDRDHLHNHILLSPFNNETGKRDILNKKSHLYKIRATNDQISREHGLSVLEKTVLDKNRNVHPKAKVIARRGGQSYWFDLQQKADFARSASTSFDEYCYFLSVMDVQVRVENKNISYKYPGRERFIRGKSLGQLYDKEKLNVVFKENEERFKSHSHLKEHLIGFNDSGSESIRIQKEKMLSSFEEFKNHTIENANGNSVLFKANRRDKNFIYKDLHIDPVIPKEELQKARNQSLFGYCKRNGISLINDQNGGFKLSGREHISIYDDKWINHKNKTEGNIIDFVAIHKQTSYLRAISEINQNPHLLLLENLFGETKRNFNPFYIPKDKQKDVLSAVNVMSSFLKKHGIKNVSAKEIFEKNIVHVSQHGGIRLFNAYESKGGIEFSQNEKGDWTSKPLGNVSHTRMSVVAKGRDLFVFNGIDIFMNFLKKGGGIHLKNAHLLVSENDSIKAVDLFLLENVKVKNIFMIGQDTTPHLTKELNRRYQDLHLGVHVFDFDQSLSRGMGLSL